MSKHHLQLSTELTKTVAGLKLPNPLGFGQHTAPIMATCQYTNESWQEPQLEALKPLELLPSSKAFHYGQQIFEGLKAYRQGDGPARLFRIDKSAERFAKSATRMAMPLLDDEQFISCVESLVYHLKDFIPQGFGESLYLRPVMIATECGMSLSRSNDYLFYVLASPSGSYFAADKVVALIERNDCRAAPGGTGAVKTSGNYGGSIKSAITAKGLGCQQTLWLDARESRYIEEFSGMNFFAVIDDKLFTPELTSSILPGITRQSIIDMAADFGYEAIETKLDINQLVDKIQSGQCSEIFACGTAAVITPITALAERDGKQYLADKAKHPVANKLREGLLNLQYGLQSDPYGWTYDIKDS